MSETDLLAHSFEPAAVTGGLIKVAGNAVEAGLPCVGRPPRCIRWLVRKIPDKPVPSAGHGPGIAAPTSSSPAADHHGSRSI